ncbi:unnamed protein product [Symbiodinium natans]|uniref:Endonuclease/exonuclease/phosphatase domain-containing protein n=1 Tax=Symbiodinium natans TaxID=878477 RepID=A0A812H5B7_9DINO|nr:unnamed protein product [Symbiodinium natans]
MGNTSGIDCAFRKNCCAGAVDRTVGFEYITEGRSSDVVRLNESPGTPTRCLSLPTSLADAPKQLQEYRLRFYNFNMGNNSDFRSVDELSGPGGRGAFCDALSEALADGRSLDVSFATFVETRLNFTNWVAKYTSGDQKPRLDSLLTQSARREGSLSSRNLVRSFVEGLAASYNGNLKSMLAFCSDEFREDKSGGLFGRLTEKQVGGVPVPNPKKAFIGRSLVLPSATGEGIRLCFVSCHFPITQIAAALEDPLQDPLEAAKIALAKTLRKVLRKAHQRSLTDERTIIFVQGDLNSRTVLREGEVNDVLLELLEDESLQSAIQQQLDDLPAGRWRETVSHDSVHDLPVTYKFSNKKMCQTGNSPARRRAESPKSEESSSDHEHYLTIGDVMSKARSQADQADSAPELTKVKTTKTTSTTASSKRTEGGLYKRTLATLGQEWLDNWGVAFKQKDFRSFRFPSCADRVIYWASDALYDRLSWELPRGGYELNHSQLGSDHRPVSLEVILRVSEESVRTSKPLQPARSYMTEGYLSEPEDTSMSEAEDGLDSCEATPRTVASSPPAFGHGEARSLSRRRSESDASCLASDDE